MTPNIPEEDKLSRRFISLEEKFEILDRLKSDDKLTSLRKEFNRNGSTIRGIRASAGALSSLFFINKKKIKIKQKII